MLRKKTSKYWNPSIQIAPYFERLIGISGLIFAVVDDNVTVEEAIANKGQTVSPGNLFMVAAKHFRPRLSVL